jgi:hypothetical protein
LTSELRTWSTGRALPRAAEALNPLIPRGS